MKEIISRADFDAVLEALGLTGETIQFELGPRRPDEVYVGMSRGSEWRLKVVIAPRDSGGRMYETHYIPIELSRFGEQED